MSKYGFLNSNFKELAADTGQGNGPVISRIARGAFLEYRGDRCKLQLLKLVNDSDHRQWRVWGEGPCAWTPFGVWRWKKTFVLIIKVRNWTLLKMYTWNIYSLPPSLPLQISQYATPINPEIYGTSNFCSIVRRKTSCGAKAQQTPSLCCASRGFSELAKNTIRSSHGHSTPSLKISCKSVQPFSRNLANKETKKSIENNTPSPEGPDLSGTG